MRKSGKKFIFPISFSQLSIQQRLPLLICALLLSVIIIFGGVSYVSVRKAAMKEGHTRLLTLTDQLSSMLYVSSRGLATATYANANQPAIKKYLQTRGKDSAQEASGLIEKMRDDPSSVLLQLLDSSGQRFCRFHLDLL